VTRVKGASGINVVAGIWLFVSAWVYGSYTLQNAWNNWIVGALIMILGAIRLSDPMKTIWASWINCALGIWTFASPWIYGYRGSTDRTINSMVVGVVVFVLGIISATAVPRITGTGPSQQIHAQ
jgi:hypothetical protein